MPWILLLIIAASLAYFLIQRPRINRDGKRIKRPSGTLPILGNAITFLRPRHILFDWFVQCQKRFGLESYEISVPSLPPAVVVSSPENVEYVLKNESFITKGEFFKKRSWDLFGYGIINASGDLWRAQRKAGLKFFSGNNLDVMVEQVLPEYYQGTRNLFVSNTETGKQIDLQQVFLDLTTTVVGHMAYDMHISASSEFSKAFDHSSLQTSYRFQNPFYPIVELFSPSGSKFRKSLFSVKRFGRKIVLNARKRRSRVAFDSLITNEELSDSMFGSLIDSLLETFNDDEVVADSAMNFLSAGRDTTAQSLTWTFYALIRHPDVLRRLRQEVDEKLPRQSPPTPAPSHARHATVEDESTEEDIKHADPQNNAASASQDESDTDSNTIHNPPVEITMSDLQPTSLPYASAVFYESLRLYPPVPIEIKQTTKSITLPGDNTSLPAGTIILWCIWALNRSERLYGPDPEVFRPERWLDSDGKFTGGKMSAWDFPVFNGGPRSCLGKKMAEVLANWVIVNVVREWDFEEVEEIGRNREGMEERVSQSSLTLPMLGGLPVKVKRRA